MPQLLRRWPCLRHPAVLGVVILASLAASAPAATAQILYSPLVPGSTYEAVLTLHFDPPGRSELVGQLETAATSAPPANSSWLSRLKTRPS